MNMRDIATMSLDEVQRELEDLEEAYSNLRFQKATHQMDNPVKLRYMRRDIARLKTVVHEYELGIRKSRAVDQP